MTSRSHNCAFRRALAPIKMSGTNKKPKRPLTPYNLFYRFKRSKIIQANSAGINDKTSILRVVESIPGLENMSTSELKLLHPKDIYAISRDNVIREMHGSLLPFEGKRSHRKTHGMMNFLEMSRIMVNQWKLVDDNIKAIFEELADEGKKLHRQRMMQYEAESSTDDHVIIDDDLVRKNQFQAVDKSYDVAFIRSVSTDESLSSVTEDKDASSSRIPDRVNIVTPITSKPTVQIDFVTSEGEDEFSQFIDTHINLVETVEPSMLDLEDSMPNTLVDLINMDETIDHCKLGDAKCNV